MEKAVRIPKCMSTQHPDNVNLPFFAESTELGGEDEIQEAYYAFSHLGCDEQMWDCEGKEVDNYVVKKLLTKYEAYFRDKKLGRDVYITLRVPNPTVEKTEAKILLETLESIPRSYDAAKMFYKDDVAPIFEVILPMCGSPKCCDRIYRYYADYVVGKQHKPFRAGDITIAEWIGEFKPEKINVIPLYEDMEHMLDAGEMTKTYLEDKDTDYQRVFLARSDPAINYGFITAVLLNKIALQRLDRLSDDIGVPIYPIIGVGSAPFRGNLRPDTVDKVIREYPSVYTFTLQSAFKYDNPPNAVENAVEKLQEREPGPPQEIDEGKCLDIIQKYTHAYQLQIEALAPVINEAAKYVPSRRRRKLHIGLFGYSRNMKGITLPRAITFTSALYSIGLPPEILGLNALTREEIDYVKLFCVNFDDDLKDAMQYYNRDNPYMPAEIKKVIENLPFQYKVNGEHKEITDSALKTLREKKGDMGESVLRAANLRKFLG